MINKKYTSQLHNIQFDNKHGHLIGFILIIRPVYFKQVSLDCSARRRLQWEQHELKAPQEQSDEEIEAVPTESVRMERKSTLFGFYCQTFYYEIDLYTKTTTLKVVVVSHWYGFMI